VVHISYASSSRHKWRALPSISHIFFKMSSVSLALLIISRGWLGRVSLEVDVKPRGPLVDDKYLTSRVRIMAEQSLIIGDCREYQSGVELWRTHLTLCHFWERPPSQNSGTGPSLRRIVTHDRLFLDVAVFMHSAPGCRAIHCFSEYCCMGVELGLLLRG
jgi:hypothetical protein